MARSMKTIKAAIKQRSGEPPAVSSPPESQATSHTSRPRRGRRSRPSRSLSSRIKLPEAETEDFTEELATVEEDADEENSDDEGAMDVAAAGPSTSNSSAPPGHSQAKVDRVSAKTPADRKAVEHKHLLQLQVCSANLRPARWR